MKVYYYSEMQKLIEKSGVGRAIYHQKEAAVQNGLEVEGNLKSADIVHINTVFPKSPLIAYLAHKHGIPVVYHAHSTKEDFRDSFIGSNLFSALFGKWIKFCYNTGDMIITPTPYSKRLLKSYGINKKIEVVSNGIDLDFFRRELIDKKVFQRKYGYGNNDIVIMGCGLIIERKGILDFIELAKQMPEYQFIWFGETELSIIPRKIKRAIRIKLPNLRFAGYVSREELREAYGSCDLFLFPSKEETEGIVVLEALAMKIPVLVRNIPVYEDWLKEDVDVYKAKDLGQFKENIDQILESNSSALYENAYQCAKERNIKEVGKKLCSIYQKNICNYKN